MSVIIEQALFKSVNHALNFAYKMKYVSVHPSLNLNKTARFNNWTDLSQLDVHAQAAFIRDIVETRLKEPEAKAIAARHDFYNDKLTGILGVSKHVQQLTKNQGECLDMIVASLYGADTTIRMIASNFGVSIRSIEDDRLVALGHIGALEKMAYSNLEAEFRKHRGVIE